MEKVKPQKVPATKTKLWHINNTPSLHPLIEAYTVGTDYQLDQKLLGYDIQASKAHANMLQHIGVLSVTEANKLMHALDDLRDSWAKGDFEVTQEQEDGHTAIEAYLIERLGDIGKKIHAGRSRNDQALVMMRLYLKDQMEQANKQLAQLAKAFKEVAKRAGDTPMPGYTHMQKAMPSTVGAWLRAYSDAFQDGQVLIDATLQIIDQNPLGSAAGFGTTLAVDRTHTTKALGFKRTQENPLYCGLSRGLFELMAVQALQTPMLLAGKFAQDMILFTTQEFDFFSLPNSLTTGSSIMPHKQNYDVFEVMRGHAHVFGSYAQQLQAIVGGVGSGYHRDLQLTKATAINGCETAIATLEILAFVLKHLVIHKDKLIASITLDMLSVTHINELVDQGMPFRDAYIQVKKTLQPEQHK